MKQLNSENTFLVPLSYEAHTIANEHRARQHSSEKAKSVYITELAIYAVNKMLQCSQINTDWQSSNNQDPLDLQFTAIGELNIKGVGKIECCALLPDDEVFRIPSEAWGSRLAYVAVRLDESLKKAEILGFVNTPAEVVTVEQLKPLDELIPQLVHLYSPKVNITKWLEGAVENRWKFVHSLLSPDQLKLTPCFRKEKEICRGRVLDLGMQLEKHSVALVLTVSSEASTEINVRAQLYPISTPLLFPGAKLIFTDSSDNRFEVVARDADMLIQDEYLLEEGENFNITIALDQVSITTEFTT